MIHGIKDKFSVSYFTFLSGGSMVRRFAIAHIKPTPNVLLFAQLSNSEIIDLHT